MGQLADKASGGGIMRLQAKFMANGSVWCTPHLHGWQRTATSPRVACKQLHAGECCCGMQPLLMQCKFLSRGHFAHVCGEGRRGKGGGGLSALPERQEHEPQSVTRGGMHRHAWPQARKRVARNMCMCEEKCEELQSCKRNVTQKPGARWHCARFWSWRMKPALLGKDPADTSMHGRSQSR